LWVAVHPAEVTENRRDAEIPYGCGVVHVEEFELLAYADRTSSLPCELKSAAQGRILTRVCRAEWGG
jgi:hypothetical protein